MASNAFFTFDDENRLIPTPFASSLWAPDSVSGPAICAAAARAAESVCTANEFRPARFTIELFKAARNRPTTIRSRVVRDGRRIKVVDVEVVQPDDRAGGESGDETVVASATTVFLRTSSNPPGGRWSRPDVEFGAPAADDDDMSPWFGSDITEESMWTREMEPHQTDRRKQLWTNVRPVVPDEELTPFQRGVISAESTSLTGNWGSTGIGFINCDLTVAFGRLPEGRRVGVAADSHIEFDGISVSTSTLYDAAGVFGTGLVTAINNAVAEIDFTTLRKPNSIRLE